MKKLIQFLCVLGTCGVYVLFQNIWYPYIISSAYTDTGAYYASLKCGFITTVLFAFGCFLLPKWINILREDSIQEKQKTLSSISDSPEPQPQEAPTPSKARYCKLCGSAIDPSTKKCTCCGKQYFSFAAARRIALPILAISLIVAVGFFLYSQYQTIITDYQNQIDTLNTALSESKSNLSAVSRERDSLSMQVKRLESDVTELKNAAAKTAGELRFYRAYAVIVLTDSPYSYHTYNCSIFQASSSKFRIYNISQAEANGYTPCPECHD